MSTGIPDTKQQLWIDGQSILLNFTRTTIGTPGSLKNGTIYTIISPGNTDFTLIGSPNNNIGTIFTAIINGSDLSSGTGIVTTPASGVSGTSGTLSWNIPKQLSVYNGILITSAIKEINSSNFPTDTVKYNSSSNLSIQADMIGNAQVIGAFYNDVTTTTLYISGLIPDVAYYFSAHACTNVYSYYTFGTQSYAQSSINAPGTFAADIQKSYGPPVNPTPGQVYFDENQKIVFVWDTISTSWAPTSPSNILTNNFDPIPGQVGLPVGYPALGDFFYNTTQRALKCWDGTQWGIVNTSPGVPMYQKENVGSDLTYQARSRMIESIKMQLGYPVVCVELLENHYNIAIDNALQELRHRTDVAYNKEYFFLQIQQFQDIYYLNDPATGTDKIVDVLKIHRLNMLGLVNFAPDNIYAQQFLNQFYAPGVSYDLVSIHLISAMSETFEQLFAGSVAFNWREARREMQIYRKFGTPEKVLIECSCEKPEQELLQDRWVQQWLMQWAKSVCMMTLAQIRGKYANLPGPGGGLTMNAGELMSEGQRLQEDALRQITDFEVGQNGPDNSYLPFMVG